MLQVVSGHRSDVGRVRRLNEDAVLAGARIWAVADGMGGHAAGDVASRLVIEELDALDAAGALRPADVVRCLGGANDRIIRHGAEHPKAAGLGTTVTGLALVSVGGADHWAVFNVGDSRVYRVMDGQLSRATIDHSETEELVLDGAITPEQARTHHARNVVTRSLGMPAAPQVDVWVLPQTPGERFLICSDGLTGELDDGTISAIVGDHPAAGPAADALVMAAVRHGGRDNVSVVVVNVEGTLQSEAEGDTNPQAREVP